MFFYKLVAISAGQRVENSRLSVRLNYVKGDQVSKFNKKGHMAGKRISGTHTTVIPSAETVARFALGLSSVKKVGLGEITMAKSAHNSEPKIIIRELNPEVLQVKVLAKGKAQILRVSTRDQKMAIAALEQQFSDQY